MNNMNEQKKIEEKRMPGEKKKKIGK